MKKNRADTIRLLTLFLGIFLCFLPGPDKGYANTIVHTGLDLESCFHDVNLDKRALDEMIAEAKEKIKIRNKQDIGSASKTFHKIRVIVKKWQKDHKFVSYVLRDNDCKNSLFYIAIARGLDLPVTLVRTPRHVLVRYIYKNNKWMNWESTSRRFCTDGYYKRKFNISQESIDRGVYLRSLSDDEILAVHHNVVGNAWLHRRKLDKAIEAYNSAIELCERYPLIHYNRGLAYFYKGDLDQAIANFDRAIEYNPKSAKPYYFRSQAKKRKGDHYDANKDLEQAASLGMIIRR